MTDFTDFTDFTIFWCGSLLLCQLVPQVLYDRLLPLHLQPHCLQFRIGRVDMELESHLANRVFVGLLALRTPAVDDVRRPLVMDVLQPGKVADIQADPVRPRTCDIPPAQVVVHVYGVPLRRGPPFASATVYVLNVEDEMVWLRNCRRYKVRQRGDDACTVVALVPLRLIRMLQRVHVEVVLDDEMSPSTNVCLRLVIGDVDNLAAGVLQLLEESHARMVVPVHIKPFLSPKGNRSHMLKVNERRCGNLRKHFERKKGKDSNGYTFARVPIKTTVDNLTLQFFPKRTSTVTELLQIM